MEDTKWYSGVMNKALGEAVCLQWPALKTRSDIDCAVASCASLQARDLQYVVRLYEEIRRYLLHATDVCCDRCPKSCNHGTGTTPTTILPPKLQQHCHRTEHNTAAILSTALAQHWHGTAHGAATTLITILSQCGHTAARPAGQNTGNCTAATPRQNGHKY